MKALTIRTFFASALLLAGSPALLAQSPKRSGDIADMRKPVQVFLIMGQSNTLEMGKVRGGEGSLEHAVREEGLYPFLLDDAGGWATRRDVRNVHVMGSGGPAKSRLRRNDWLTVSVKKIGIEQGIGHQLGDAIDAPVLLLKSSIGNRSLGWDLLPPGSGSYEFTDPKDGKTYVYAGFGQSPLRWEKGSEPEPIGWSAGLQYTGDVARAKTVLKDLGKYYPGATKYEVKGFLWWQGDKDRYNAGHASKYGENLVRLVAALRADFDAPDAKFVCATLGQTDEDAVAGDERRILEGMFALSDAKQNPSLRGAVATIYTHPLSMGSSSNAHYGGNAKTYMNVGVAMGAAMVELLGVERR